MYGGQRIARSRLHIDVTVPAMRRFRQPYDPGGQACRLPDVTLVVAIQACAYVSTLGSGGWCCHRIPVLREPCTTNVM